MPQIEPVIVQAPMGDDPPTATLYYGADCRDSLCRLPDKSIHTVCTSPPYWGLRDYGNDPSVWGGDKDCDHDWGGANTREARGQYCTKCDAWLGQLGLEPDPYAFVDHLVEIFSEVKRVLRDDGTLWLNLGDSYANPGIQSSALSSTGGFTGDRVRAGKKGTMNSVLRAIPEGIKYKDLVGIPWMVAFALRANGWYLRADIIWAKKNPMPESVTDRPTKAHEYLFLMTKQEQYFYDAAAIKEPIADYRVVGEKGRMEFNVVPNSTPHRTPSTDGLGQHEGGRNKRSVWNVNTKPYRGAHFATWPEDLVEPMILAGTGAMGCCATCGAAYKRVVEREEGRVDRPNHQYDPGRPDGMTLRGGRLVQGKILSESWQPTCACNDGIGDEGCCIRCGAAYKQTIEKENPGRTYEYKAVGIPGEGANRGRRTGSMGTGLPVKSVTWEPGCECEDRSHVAIGGYPDRKDGGTRVKDSSGGGGNVLATKRVATDEMIPQCECPPATKRCIVLDPFSGSATTGKVANDHGRDYIGLDANTEYLDMAVARLQNRAAPSPNDTPDESSVLDLFG